MATARPIKISEDVLGVLSAAEFDGNKLVLTGTLDRRLYVETNKVLDAAGGKWNRSAKAHVFEGDAAEAVEPIILTGEYSRTKQDFGQFDSPPEVVDRIMELAAIEPGMNCLEPSAGIGNIAAAAQDAGAVVIAYEVDPKRAAIANERLSEGCNVADFLTIEPHEVPYDHIVMNPPFAGQADIQHVLHAAKFLRTGGRLVSVMSAGVLFRQDRRAAEFRAFVEGRGGTFERLPEDAFKASGTGVNTCIVTFEA